MKAATSVSWPKWAFASVVKLSVKVPDPLHWTVIVELWPVVAGGLLVGGFVKGGEADAGSAYALDSSTIELIVTRRRFFTMSSFRNVWPRPITCQRLSSSVGQSIDHLESAR